MNHRFVRGFLSLAALVMSPSLFADESAIEKFLSDAVTRNRVPGLAVAIVNGEGVVYSGCFGFASGRRPVTPDTVFALGSTTKSFTALASLDLESDGKIDLDSPVTKYLPEFKVASPGFADRITIRHLLNHTSGLSDSGMPEGSGGEASLARELESIGRCVPSGEPGEGYRYFNGNYRLLGAVIERVSGMRYEDFLHARIFAPLGMNSTGSWGDATFAETHVLAEGHGSLFGFPLARGQAFRAGALPSGYLASSVSDIGKYLIEEIRVASGTQVALDGNAVRKSWEPHSNEKESYAMGWLSVTRPDGNRFLVHGGSLENFQSFFCIDPARKIGFVMLMNQGGLIPMTGSFNEIRDGLVSFIGGEDPVAAKNSPVLPVVMVVLFLVLAIEIPLFMRLKKWKGKAAGARNVFRIISIFAECAFASLPLYLFPLMNGLMGDYADWALLWGLIPEVVIIVSIVSASSAVRAALKIYRIRIS